MTPDITGKPAPTVTVVGDALVAMSHMLLPGGTGILELSLADGFDSFKDLPPVLEYQGLHYGKTGWNSDKMVGYWRTDALMVRKVAS